ncbi:MAG: hypothetical protein M9921_12530 [Fimbriimonadaceae bacterium]|nr:hypothetical protein [Chthonomonadaceae bacterium]MCO5297674.1 hypothetical protein [Fimbriimonadaceae bacterium]
MLERITEHPLVFFGGCVVWIPVAIWVISLVHWMIQGDIDVVFGIPGVIAAFVLGGFTLNPPTPALSPVFLMVAVLGVVLFPSLRAALDRRALARIDDESLASAHDALKEKPDNVGARLRIARVIAQKGLPGHAAAIAYAALHGLPEAHFTAELREAAKWKAQGAYPDASRPIVCAACGESNGPGDLYCSRCRAPFLLDWAQGRWSGDRTARKLVAVWISAILAMVGIPSAAAALPPVVAVLAIVVLFALVGGVLWLAFRPERRQVVL